MWVCVQDFHTPKNGSTEAEYEDAFYPSACFHRGVDGFRCAVADGASESAFSREWARLLVRGFGRRRWNLNRLQRVWSKLTNKGPLPWYLEAKVKKGAHAAFVGLSIQENGSNEWRALAIGDSCLFHTRNNKLLLTGPVEKSELFDNSPYLLSSRSPMQLTSDSPHVHTLTGEWQSKDAFYLATDALSQWLLAEEEAGRPQWELLSRLGTKEETKSFQTLVTELRGEKILHNDDTTLLRLEVI